MAGTSATTQFLYDGDELIDEYNTSNVLLNRYVHGRGVDDPILSYAGAGAPARWLHADHQGSIIALVGTSGTPVAINTYDEYGIPGVNSGRFQYTGQVWLPELGMYYYKARIYSPTLGRFMQTDPIGYDDQINLYAYVENDPVNGRDPTGLRVVVAGTPEYRAEAIKELRQIWTGKNGKEMLTSLFDSKNTIYIKATADGGVSGIGNYTEAEQDWPAGNGRGTGSTIYYDPLEKGGIDINGSKLRPPFAGLAHELGHAEDNDKGTRPAAVPGPKERGTTPAIERNAVTRENQVRVEHGIAPRTTYIPPEGCLVGPGKCK